MRKGVNIKKPIIQLMLCVYVFALIKPLTPAMNDFIAHHFWKSEHISTVHCENGKYHLHVELARATDEDAAEKNGTTSSEDFLYTHLKCDPFALQTPVSKQADLPIAIVQQAIDLVLPAVIPPPEV
jgi:hypothetical protein